jgi:opacity protein-like surface antigen
MDSIFVKQRTNTIHIREPTKQKRFSIGLQAGYGMTPKGFQPYVGLGVSVNLWTF